MTPQIRRCTVIYLQRIRFGDTDRGRKSPDEVMTEPDPPHVRPIGRFTPFRLIGPLILIVLLAHVDLRFLWALLSKLAPIQIVSAGAAVLGLLLVRCERWHQLLNAAGFDLERQSTYPSCLRAIWIGYITPGRIGEFKRGLDIVKWKATNPISAGSLVLIDLGADAVVALGIVFLALLLAYVMATPIIVFSGGTWISILIGIAIAASLRPLFSLSSLALSRIGLATVGSLLNQLAQVPRRVLLLLFALTIVSNAFYVAMMIPLFSPIAPALTLSNVVIIVMVAAVAGMVPITYFGLGTRESALVIVLTQAGHSSELAIALSLTFVVAMAIGFLVAIALDALFRMTRFKAAGKT